MENLTEEKCKRPGVCINFNESCPLRKRVEYILSPKDADDNNDIVIPFLFKIKDTDEYLLFKGVQTCKLKSEESYDKITNRNLIRYLVWQHNESLQNVFTEPGIIKTELVFKWGNLAD